MIVTWLDPGKLTGVATYNYWTNTFSVDEFDFERTGQRIEKIMAAAWSAEREDSLYLGWESFRITAKTAKNTQAPWSLEVIGMARWLAHQLMFTLLPEAAPADRLVCTDKMITDLGFYPLIKGKKDAKSALQHLVAWMLRTNQLPDDWKPIIYGPLK